MAPPSDRELLERIDDNVKGLMSAFNKDENGDPKYAEHLIFHKRAEEKQKQDDRGKYEIKSNIISWAVIGVMTAIISFLLNNPGIIIGYLGK